MATDPEEEYPFFGLIYKTSHDPEDIPSPSEPTHSPKDESKIGNIYISKGGIKYTCTILEEKEYVDDSLYSIKEEEEPQTCSAYDSFLSSSLKQSSPKGPRDTSYFDTEKTVFTIANQQGSKYYFNLHGNKKTSTRKRSNRSYYKKLTKRYVDKLWVMWTPNKKQKMIKSP